MSYKPRTYAEYKNGLTQGQTITVDDNTTNDDLTLPLLGKNYQNYGPVISQQNLFLSENFNTNNALNLLPNTPNGAIIYDNSAQTITINSQFGPIVLDPSEVIIDESSLIPSASFQYNLGSEIKRWDELHVNTLYVNALYINNSDGTATLLEDTFVITSDDVVHTGSKLSGSTITETLNYLNENTAAPSNVVEITEATSLLDAIDNSIYIYLGSVPTTLEIVETDLDDLISFNVVATNGNTLSLTVPSGTSDIFNNEIGLTTIDIVDSVTIMKENKGTYNSWSVSGGYTNGV